jgi:hypothetical protein
MPTRKETLSDIITPWIETLNLPGSVYPWEGSEAKIRGESHWYTKIRTTVHRHEDGTREYEDWIMTIRGTHVEVRNNNDVTSPVLIGWHTISAADPEFLVKLERALRAALDYLARN